MNRKTPLLLAALLLIACGFFYAGHTTISTKSDASPASVRTAKPKTVFVLKDAPTPDPVVSARRVKALADLEQGDRVLYGEAHQPRRLCDWVYWGGSIDFATINCGTKDFTVKTGFLTPVERR